MDQTLYGDTNVAVRTIIIGLALSSSFTEGYSKPTTSTEHTTLKALFTQVGIGPEKATKTLCGPNEVRKLDGGKRKIKNYKLTFESQDINVDSDKIDGLRAFENQPVYVYQEDDEGNVKILKEVCVGIEETDQSDDDAICKVYLPEAEVRKTKALLMDNYNINDLTEA